MVPFAVTSAKIASEIEHDLREKSEDVDFVDVLIAAVAIERGSVLVTRDEGYKHIEGLKVEFFIDR